MPYNGRPSKGLRRLRSRARLERAMRNADLNGAELAAYATAKGQPVSRQAISNLRNGRAFSCRVELAEVLERALRVEPGDLFGPPTPRGLPLPAEEDDEEPVGASA